MRCPTFSCRETTSESRSGERRRPSERRAHAANPTARPEVPRSRSALVQQLLASLQPVEIQQASVNPPSLLLCACSTTIDTLIPGPRPEQTYAPLHRDPEDLDAKRHTALPLRRHAP